jgi:hypothetical protein
MWMRSFRTIQRFLRCLRPRSAARVEIVYQLPVSSVYRKFFNRDIFFQDVNWEDWLGVVDGFQRRFDGWYFENLQRGHAAYMDLVSLCALVDVFSYYVSQNDWHDPGSYREFLRRLDAQFRRKLVARIEISRPGRAGGRQSTLKDYADVFYSGVRCSLHHHGDLASYAGMNSTGSLAMERASAGASICGNYSYPIVVFDPGVLGERLRDWLHSYCAALKHDPHSERSILFRRKFRRDFGLTIPEP